MDSLVNFSPIVGVVGLAFALALYLGLVRGSTGTERMQEIAAAIQSGAMAFLRREYTILFGFVTLVSLLLAWGLNWQTAVAFLGGAFCSTLAGFSGMRAATEANVRTAAAAKDSGQGRALLTAFNGGAVMGIAVASLGLVGLGLFFLWFGKPDTASIINGFAMGASSIALFARVGGGIYTKAADIGADLVGKVEAGIPEDDPRNPGVIADNVGDNVGDVAGMGADLYESYYGSILASMALAAAAAYSLNLAAEDAVRLVVTPLALAGIGIMLAIVGYSRFGPRRGRPWPNCSGAFTEACGSVPASS